MKQNMLIRRTLSLVLAVSMMLSNLALVTSAEELICTDTEHNHTEECYAAPAAESTVATEETTVPTEDVTEPTDETTIPMEDVTEPTEETAVPTENVTEPTEETAVPTEEVTEPTEPESPTYAQQLLAQQTLQAFHDALMADPQMAYSLTAEELTALSAHVETLYGTLETPSEDEEEYYVLLTETFAVLLEESGVSLETLEEPIMEYDKITIDGIDYVITNEENQVDKEKLVDADLALLAWDAMGNSTTDEDSTSRISGVFDGKEVSGYWAVYEKIYDLLLKNQDSTFKVSYDSASVTNTKIYKFSKADGADSINISQNGSRTVSGRLIIVAEDTATLNMTNDGRFQINGGGTVVIQGRSKDKPIHVTGTNTTRSNSVFNVSNGSLYLSSCNLSKYQFTSNAKSVICFPTGNTTRHLYMTNSSLSDITASGSCESAGIFCSAFNKSGTEQALVEESSLYIHNSTFTNCVTQSGTTVGGSAIRSYAADRCDLQVKNCTFTENKAYGTSTGSGGGAIYWKSALGEATVIGCTFSQNYAARVGGAIYNTGDMVIIGCTFKENSTDGNGGAIAVEPPFTTSDYTLPYDSMSGSLTLDAQTQLIGNNASKNGGALYFNANASRIGSHAINAYTMNLDIEGATITGNTAENGGGIAMWLTYADRSYTTGIAVKENSTISGNTATGNGGAIWMSSDESCECKLNNGVTMYGGTLDDNTAANGGALYISTGKTGVNMDFQLIDGDVTNNEATSHGGAAYISGGNFTMTGGTLDSNAATSENGEGGAVYVTGGNITLGTEGCTDTNCLNVSNNRAVNGGAFAVAGATPTMHCGTLTGNTAENMGGALYVSGTGGFTMLGGIIDGGEAESNANLGGGVYLANGTFTMEGATATIQNNKATDGAGVYLSGGQPDLKQGALTGNTASGKGGGIFIDRQIVRLEPTGPVSITGNEANQGAGIFIGGTQENSAGFSVEVTGGSVDLSSNTATAEGGAVCIQNGSFDLAANNISLLNNQAANGGAVAVLSGDFTMSDGAIGAQGNGNYATKDGGAVYVSGGNAAISGGSISHNSAGVNGGGIAVNDGQIVMSGGSVSHNQALSGFGGGMFVSSSGAQEVSAKIFSGIVSHNSAALSGGAVGLQGLKDSNTSITVQIGVNKAHFDENGNARKNFVHEEDGKSYIHADCPVIESNTADTSGGAFYITGSNTTKLNIYCLTEANNEAKGDMDVHSTPLSNFLMVDGGQVIISTSSEPPYEAIKYDPAGFGLSSITGSIHVVGGKLDLYGTMNNPRIESVRTVDVHGTDQGYTDHRGNSDTDLTNAILKVSYNENFYEADGTPALRETAIDVIHNHVHSILQYFYQHEGYELLGWNTDSKATEGTPSGWFHANEEYHFFYEKDKTETDFTNKKHTGNLTLYAIWKTNGYTIAFDPGVKDGDSWSGSVESIPCQYNKEYTLPANGFVYPGNAFAGWRLNGKTYQPGASVINLTGTDAETVTFTAQWSPCAHNGTSTYTVSGSDTIIKTCDVCGYSATAKLTAKNAVYDKTSHYATAECSDPVFWTPGISYTGTKIGSTESVERPETCVNAGNYIAIIEVGDARVSTNFTIAKAEQPAPTSRPKYTQPSSGESQLTIHPLPENEQISSVSGAAAVYVLRYYNNGVEQNVVVQDEDSQKDGIQYNLTEALKTYAVLAQYAGTDNYNPSDYISAESTFVFAGNLHLTVIAEAGINTWGGDVVNDELTIYVALQDGFYLADDDFTFTKSFTIGEISDNSYSLDSINIKKRNGSDGAYTVSATNASKDVYITITIGGVKKEASISAKAREKQHFSEFEEDTATEIARDSAFTVLYSLRAYDSTAYQTPVLTFAPAVPNGTTIILRDRTDGSYWYYTADETAETVALTAFKAMGSRNTSYSLIDGDRLLQFIVDFSRADNVLAGNSLNCSMSIDRKRDSKAPDDLIAYSCISLADVTHTMTAGQEEGLTQSLALDIEIGAVASKYDHRDLALVLTPKTDLPVDARIQMRMQNSNVTYHPNRFGNFILPLKNFQAMDDTVQLELSSDMFPITTSTYKMDAALYLSQSDAEEAPLNGTQLVISEDTEPKTSVELTFSIDKMPIGIKIDNLDGDKRLYRSNEVVKVKVTATTGYTVTVQAQQKMPTGYGNAGLKHNESNGVHEFTLGTSQGSYCIVAELRDSRGYVVSEARYYFILQDPAN